jgi:hypothetical protein
VSPNEFVFLLDFGPQIGAVLLQDELGFVSVNQKLLLDEGHLQLPGQIGKLILKKKMAHQNLEGNYQEVEFHEIKIHFFTRSNYFLIM